MSDLLEILAKDAKDRWELFNTAAAHLDLSPILDPAVFSSLQRVFAFSTFVFRTCRRHPEMLLRLIDSGDLRRCYNPLDYNEKIQAALHPVFDTQSLSMPTLQKALRLLRQREMVRIAWRDLSGWADLAETTRDLSAFAETCIDRTLGPLYADACSKFGVPEGADRSRQHLVVIAMGKLGAGELNFSSDIDLVLAYPEAGETERIPQSITNDEFFTRLTRQLLVALGAATSDGIVFRVDTRLRPFGESGPLVMSFDVMEAYYQSQGREWERYAWIKARPVAGDIAAGNELIERLRPFVYRRYLDFGTFDSLRDMKQKISMEVRRKSMAHNVKLGPGGIREIEFFGHLFQLIRGGVFPALQERRIQNVLEVLGRKRIVPPHVCSELAQAYVFLRNTEHRLQEFCDQQTHDLPQEEIDRTRLAAAMGFSGWEAFFDRLRLHRERVHAHFSSLLEAKDTVRPDTGKRQLLIDLWQDSVNIRDNTTLLGRAGFHAPNQVLHILEQIRSDPETRKLGREGRKRLNALIPMLLEKIVESENQTVVLGRLAALIRTIQRRTCYLALLQENPTVLNHLIRLAAASSWIISFLAMHPLLLDELIDPRTLYLPPCREELEEDLGRRLAHLSKSDLEQQMEVLRIFKQISVLRVAAADISGCLPLMRVSDHLTDIAETILKQVLTISWNHLSEKHGEPACGLKNRRLDRGFAVIAYGKLGGIELGYASDLDLVFLHAGKAGQTQGGSHPIDNTLFFSRLGQRFIHILTTHTPAGKLYETDMRLRPSGASGLLVSHIDAFADYQNRRAWTWEHQALVRARPVCGDPAVAEHFENIRVQALSRFRDRRILGKEVLDMRRRLRRKNRSRDPETFDLSQGEGGMVDIEFLVQYLVLANAHDHSNLLKWTDNVRLLESLCTSKIIDSTTAALLKDAYLSYRSAAHRLNLQEKPNLVDKTAFGDLRKEICDLWRKHFDGL